MNWHQRLTRAREAKKLTKSAFARLVGVSPPTVTDWESGKIKKIEGANLIKVCEVLEITPEQLLRGAIQAVPLPHRGAGGREFDQNVTPKKLSVRPIPVISPVQAGLLKEISDPYPPGAGFDVEYVDEEDDYSDWTFGLEIEGESMMPEFRPGDRVIIDPCLTPNPGDFVVARNTKEEATFKKYRPRGVDSNGNMVFELVPLNDDFPVMRSDIEHLEILGVMVEHRKKYRRNKKR